MDGSKVANDVAAENNNNKSKGPHRFRRPEPGTNQYMDMRDSRGPSDPGKKTPQHTPLIPPETAYENTLPRGATLTELDDDGNPIQELPGYRASSLASTPSPTSPTSPVSPFATNQPQFPPEPPERSLSTVSRFGPPTPSWPPAIPEEQIALAPTSDDIDGGYLEPTEHIYSEITEVKKQWELTPSGSRIFTETTTTKKVPNPLVRRLTRTFSRKGAADDDDDDLCRVRCRCKKRVLFLLGGVLLALLVGGIIAAVLLTRMDKTKPESGKLSR